MQFYDGCLGYEGMRCTAEKCGYEFDINWKANGNPPPEHPRVISAHTRYPNTEETDGMLYVDHVVKLSDGTERIVRAMDPAEAIDKVEWSLQ